MRIAVVDLWPKPLYTTVDVGDVAQAPYQTVLYVPVAPIVDPTAIHSHLRQLPAALRRSADCFVLRPQAQDLPPLTSDSSFSNRIRHRFDERPGYVLHWVPARHELAPMTGDPVVPPIDAAVQAKLLLAIRRAETAILLRHPGAHLPDVPDIHYEGPNGSHYRNFARPGLALRTPDSIDRLCFWLQQYIQKPTVILLDSWSLLSLGLKLQLLRTANVKRVESLEDYNEPTDLILGRLSDRGGALPAHILLIISVSSTGALAARILDACRRGGCHDVTIVSLFALDTCDANLKGDVLCPLGEEFSASPASQCQRCADESVPVRIEATNYLMEVSAATRPTLITINVAQSTREFLNRYRGVDYLAVHKDQHDKQRHHMIHIDVSQLLSSPVFRDRLGRTVRPLRGHISAILAPHHDAALQLATEVHGLLGLPPNRLLVADDQTLQELSAPARQVILESENILIVDDVVITGDRYWSYRNALERAGLTASDRYFDFLVGVERTPNEETLRGVRDSANGPRHFHSIDALRLPNWGRDECPWCWERDAIAKFGEKLEEHQTMKDRFDNLRNVATGLSEKLFLHWGTDGFRPTQLGPQSPVFGNLDREVEVFVAVASIIQTLRSNGNLSERPTPPVARVLNPQLTLLGRYYASVLAASILRSTRRHDLRSTTSELSLSKGISRRLLSPMVKELRSELLFAMARRRLPLVEAAINDPAFWSGAETGVRGFLRLLLTSR